MPSPQLSPILADLERIVAAADLTHGNFAPDLFDIIVEEIRTNAAMGFDCNDKPFAELSQLYQISKGRHFPGRPITVLHGLMMEKDQLNGFRVVGPDSAVMIYGISEEAAVEAEWFQDPDPAKTTRPAREFYGLTKRAIQRCDERVHKAFD